MPAAEGLGQRCWAAVMVPNPAKTSTIALRSFRPMFILIFFTVAHFWQTLRNPFSAVSMPIFASKYNTMQTLNSNNYSLENSWRYLHDLLTFAPLRNKPQLKFVKLFRIFAGSFQKLTTRNFLSLMSTIHSFWWKTSWISTILRRKSNLLDSQIHIFLKFRNENCWIIQKHLLTDMKRIRQNLNVGKTF